MSEGKWLEIGQAVREHRLRKAVSTLDLQWPGRYQFQIRSLPKPQAERTAGFALYLRHR